eukprot:scaffold120560_cov56-Attheya_sp.AAC.3
MPPLEKDEAIAIYDCLSSVLPFPLSNEDMLDNVEQMNGITRYLFRKGYAKQKVDESVQCVNAKAIRKMVAMQSTNKGAENVIDVHALVLWSVQKDENGKMLYEAPPKFDLVSRYAESLVAKKLAEEAPDKLSAALNKMAPMSGAEGYVGALFEAYVIRKLQNGGRFTLRRLEPRNQHRKSLELGFNLPQSAYCGTREYLKRKIGSYRRCTRSQWRRRVDSMPLVANNVKCSSL